METQVVMDADLKKVCEFMQRNISAEKLVETALHVSAMAPILWGHYNRVKLCPLVLRAEKPEPSSSPNS